MPLTQLLSFSYISSYLAHPAPHDPLLVEARHEDECSHIVNRWLPLLWQKIFSGRDGSLVPLLLVWTKVWVSSKRDLQELACLMTR